MALTARIVWFSQKNEVDGAFIRDERIIWRDSGADTRLYIPGC